MKTAYRLQVLMPGTLTLFVFYFFFCDDLPSEVPERYKTMRSPNYYQNFQLPTTNQPQMETLCLPSMDPLSFPLFTQFVLMLEKL